MHKFVAYPTWNSLSWVACDPQTLRAFSAEIRRILKECREKAAEIKAEKFYSCSQESREYKKGFALAIR